LHARGITTSCSIAPTFDPIQGNFRRRKNNNAIYVFTSTLKAGAASTQSGAHALIGQIQSLTKLVEACQSIGARFMDAGSDQRGLNFKIFLGLLWIVLKFSLACWNNFN
jgi:hypothetical protein